MSSSLVEDRSPWADLGEPLPSPDPPPTSELLAEAAQERQERMAQELADDGLWERYAHRIAADGSLIR